MGTKLVNDIQAALAEQTVTVAGTTAADTVLPKLAGILKTVLSQRKNAPTTSKGSSMRTLSPRS